MSLRKRLLAIVSSPGVQLLVGLGMVACGLGELVATVGEAVAGEAGPQGAHGVVLFGVLHAIKASLELIEGFEKVGEVGASEGAIVDRAA